MLQTKDHRVVFHIFDWKAVIEGLSFLEFEERMARLEIAGSSVLQHLHPLIYVERPYVMHCDPWPWANDSLRMVMAGELWYLSWDGPNLANHVLVAAMLTDSDLRLELVWDKFEYDPH